MHYFIVCMKTFLYLIAFLFVGIAGASTVTLTGSCSNLIASNVGRYINFTLSNSGNGPASDMFLTTNLHGLYSYNISTLKTLNPNQEYIFRFPIKNQNVYKGTYGFGVLVSYAQGTQRFSVSFPCLVSYINSTKSLLVTNASTQGSQINVSVANHAPYPLNATVYFINPQGLLNPEMIRMEISKDGAYRFDSVINQSMLSPSETIDIGIITSYIHDNVSYSSLNLISFSSSPNASHTQSPIFYTGILIAAIIIFLILLIIISIIRNMKHQKKVPSG